MSAFGDAPPAIPIRISLEVVDVRVSVYGAGCANASTSGSGLCEPGRARVHADEAPARTGIRIGGLRPMPRGGPKRTSWKLGPRRVAPAVGKDML